MRKSFRGILIIVFLLVLSGHAMAAIHVVMPGETLWLISQKYGTSVAELAQQNNLVNVNHIEAGQKLNVPDAGGSQPPTPETVIHTVKAGETLWTISQKYKTTVAAIAAKNKITNVNLINVGDKLIISGAAVPPAAPAGAPVSRSGRTVSTAEFDLLARLVQAESGGEPYVGQVAVAAAVLNRVDSPRFPNTITAVIYQVTNGYYQYSPVLDGRINLPASDSARRATAEAISGADPSLGATGFYNPRKTTNQWVRSQPVTTTIGNHVFFR